MFQGRSTGEPWAGMSWIGTLHRAWNLAWVPRPWHQAVRSGGPRPRRAGHDRGGPPRARAGLRGPGRRRQGCTTGRPRRNRPAGLRRPPGAAVPRVSVGLRAVRRQSQDGLLSGSFLRFSWSITIQEGPDASPDHGTPDAPKSARKITALRHPHHAQIRRADNPVQGSALIQGSPCGTDIETLTRSFKHAQQLGSDPGQDAGGLLELGHLRQSLRGRGTTRGPQHL
ncbi:hypothetical protein JOF46_002714 [Paeniglutamicibacter psychrophenolicus]|uniref:Uncharacterized protein n=1 Tax=Paeniglutamicibacter psychrophenolicus TaxID=257454 RepID=A0ABS4WF28_9MICC|nr:hypothetical protein [Paeniglutamicibacter psychrophenolicus]